MKKIILILTLMFSYINANFVDINLGNQKIYLQEGNYKVLKFDKRILKIKIKNNKSIDVTFDNRSSLQAIKIFAKKSGNTSLFVSLANGKSFQLQAYVTKNIDTVIAIAKTISPEVIIKQVNETIVIDGLIKTIKHKNKIIDLFEKIGYEKDKNIIDLALIQNPEKMIRVKLYVAEINNVKGKTIKNQWNFGFENYTTSYSKNGDTLYFDKSKLAGYTPESASLIRNAVSLTGGLNAAASYLGDGFRTGMVLNYLSSKGVAKILDETSLITIENKDATFHAGGTIYLKMQTTTAEGLPVTDIKAIRYGLELKIRAKEIIDDSFVNLEIITKSTKIDWINTVDGIPSFTDKAISTYVVVKDKATIVLGGLINNNDAKSYSKIPLLGDIPILGALFRSKEFTSGDSELVFFITPEIVDANTNNQKVKLKANKKLFKNENTDDKY